MKVLLYLCFWNWGGDPDYLAGWDPQDARGERVVGLNHEIIKVRQYIRAREAKNANELARGTAGDEALTVRLEARQAALRQSAAHLKHLEARLDRLMKLPPPAGK